MFRGDSRRVVHGIVGTPRWPFDFPVLALLARYGGGGWLWEARVGFVPTRLFSFFASRDRGGVRRIFVSDLWMSQVARCCCLNPIGEFAWSPLGGAFHWVVCEAEEACYEVLLVCSPVQWRASRRKQPNTCWEFTSRVPSRRNQSRGAVLMGSEPRMLCMGFVRMACPEGEEDRQSSIWSGDPM